MFKYSIDKDYILQIRHAIHEYPEIGFDLPRTTALVKAELDKMGIPYTEKYGQGSIVGYLNPEAKGYTIGLRADMDALLIQETNDIPFKSKIDGHMHACGHDAHTAMLLGAAKALKEIEDQLTCRVMLLFQPAEEIESGAILMVEDGVMDEIDIIVGMHVEGIMDAGKMGICKGGSSASSRNFEIEFFGNTAHASAPQSGHDALATCVSAYGNIQLALARKMNPMTEYVCSVGKMQAGTTRNVIADYAKMEGTIRTFDMKVDQTVIDTIEEVVVHTADNFGCTSKVTSEVKSLVVFNDYELTDCALQSIGKVIGEENIAPMPKKMGSEDFSRYLVKKPGVFIRIGTRNVEKGICTLAHNNDFMIDEDVLDKGSATFVQFVLDMMHGMT
ncbi:MAG: amidohydrolase [Tyzzerella sp.]|nr:amidohydrolase [Tyzzerella sp.]